MKQRNSKMPFLILQGEKADNPEHWTIRQKDIRRTLKRKPSRSSGSPATFIKATNQKTGNLTKEPEGVDIKTPTLCCGVRESFFLTSFHIFFPYAQINFLKISEIQGIATYFVYLKYLLITSKRKLPMSKI